MKIGVLDSDGYFIDGFFSDKKITVLRDYCNISKENDIRMNGFTHGEIVCSQILKENPSAEIILIPIINNNRCYVLKMINGIQQLIDVNVNIINLSIGNEYRYHKELEDMCFKAWRKGIPIVAAHSNNTVMATYPASLPFVLGVKCIDCENANHIMEYHEKQNDIIFSVNGFSIYHLGILRCVFGNSYGCAKITGLLSHHKDYSVFLRGIIKSRFNVYYPYRSLLKKRCLFLSNRMKEPLEQKFIQEATYAVAIMYFEEGFNKLKKGEIENICYETIFIDHSDYLKIVPYKTQIVRLLLNSTKEIVIRYPLFSLFERLKYYKNEYIVINQFFI